jgi:hypothetical protein
MRWTTFSKAAFARNENYEHGGRLEGKIHILFYRNSHEPLYVDQLSFVQSKIMDIPTSFTWVIIFFDVAL